MTIPAGDRGVLTGQFEGGQIVVICSRCPAGGDVTGTTNSAKTTLVGIFRRVIGGAVLRGGLEVHKGAGIDMALPTQDLGMFPVNWKGTPL